MLESFTLETFSERLCETFHLYPEDQEPLEVELISATALGARPDEGRLRQPFSIVFRGPGDVLLPQHTYRMEHPEIGDFELFLVPIGPDEKGLRYEAIFT